MMTYPQMKDKEREINIFRSIILILLCYNAVLGRTISVPDTELFFTQVEIQQCYKHLEPLLKIACRDNEYNGVDDRRNLYGPLDVVTECCVQSCSRSTMTKYCSVEFPTTKPTTTTTTTIAPSPQKVTTSSHRRPISTDYWETGFWPMKLNRLNPPSKDTRNKIAAMRNQICYERPTYRAPQSWPVFNQLKTHPRHYLHRLPNSKKPYIGESIYKTENDQLPKSTQNRSLVTSNVLALEDDVDTNSIFVPVPPR